MSVATAIAARATCWSSSAAAARTRPSQLSLVTTAVSASACAAATAASRCRAARRQFRPDWARVTGGRGQPGAGHPDGRYGRRDQPARGAARELGRHVDPGCQLDPGQAGQGDADGGDQGAGHRVPGAAVAARIEAMT